MTPERYALIRELYESVIDLPTVEREPRLRAMNVEDGLIADVLQLMSAGDGATVGQISRPLSAVLASAGNPVLKRGEVVGVWKIEGEIGQGGMGSVYLVERSDGHFKQTAALKFLKGLPSSQRLDYFTRERQLLASLSHPNIARLLDGGATAEGQPYLVMEYVDGLHVDQYCRQNKLSVDAILKLFETACAAVAAAHRQLIVHCDLKPSNILVHHDGRPMLLDFGIATLIDKVAEGAALSEPRNSPAYTPRYASPEQRAGQAVSTVSDIFSLGILLGELLDVAGSRDDELAAIVKKAAAPDAGNRYPSVDALTEDIRRYRAGMPVRALPATSAYVAKKFLLRRWPLVIAAAIFIATVAGFTLKVATESQRAQSAEQMAVKARDNATQERDRAQAAERRALAERDATAAAQAETARERDGAKRERDRATGAEYVAEKQRNLARTAEANALAERDRAKLAEAASRQTSDFLISVFDSSDPNAESGDIPASKLLAAAEERIEKKMQGQSETQVDLLGVIGRVQYNMGNVKQSQKDFRRAVELERLNKRPLVLATMLGELAQVDVNFFGGKEALALTKEALALREMYGPAESEEMVSLLASIGHIHVIAGRLQEAKPFLERSLAIGDRIAPNSQATALSLNNLARYLSDSGQQKQAISHYRRAIAIQEKLHDEGAPTTLSTYGFLATALQKDRQFEEAETIMRKVLAAREKLHGQNSMKTVAEYLRLSNLYSDTARPREALAMVRTAGGIVEKISGRDSTGFVITQNNIARFLLDLGDYEEALPIVRDNLPRAQKLYPGNHAAVMRFARNLGQLQCEMGLWQDGLMSLSLAHEMSKKIFPAKHREIATADVEIALCSARAGKLDDAIAHMAEVDRAALGSGSELHSRYAQAGGVIAVKQGNTAEAQRYFALAEQQAMQAFPENDAKRSLAMLPRAEWLAARQDAGEVLQGRSLATQILANVTDKLVAQSPIIARLKKIQAQ